MLDANFKFDVTPKNLAAGTADQLSTNVYDAGAAVKLFEGVPAKAPLLAVNYKCTAGTGTQSWRARLVGASAAALNADVVIIADTGVVLVADDGTAIDATHNMVKRVLSLQGQQVASRYYGVIYTQGAADQDGTVTAVITEAPQTNHLYHKAAAP